jgi:hypothetical protein
MQSCDRSLTIKFPFQGHFVYRTYDTLPNNRKISGHDKMFSGHDRKVSGHGKMFSGHDRNVSGHDKMFAGHDRNVSGHD